MSMRAAYANERTNERCAARGHGETREANGAKRPAWPISKCMRTRTRVRACVHFHRARRNCKVAYMQGVKLRGRSFDPRAIDERGSRYRFVATANSCAPRVAFSMSIFRRVVAPPNCSVSGHVRDFRVFRSMKFERVSLPPLIFNLFWPSSLAIKHKEKLCTDISDEITVSYEISLVFASSATRSLLPNFSKSNVCWIKR